jgi:hypothetical protein
MQNPDNEEAFANGNPLFMRSRRNDASLSALNLELHVSLSNTIWRISTIAADFS